MENLLYLLSGIIVFQGLAIYLLWQLLLEGERWKIFKWNLMERYWNLLIFLKLRKKHKKFIISYDDVDSKRENSFNLR